MHIALLSPEWPLSESTNGIVTYVHYLRAAFLQLGHRVSVFTGRVGSTNADSDIHLVEPRYRHSIFMQFKRLTAPNCPEAYYWGPIIASKVNEVHKVDPIDILEMGESFGLCADVKRRLPFPVVVKLHGPAFLSLIDEELHSPSAHLKIASEGRALREMATIISPSPSTYNKTTDHYSFSPPIHRIIPNPVCLDPNTSEWNLTNCDRNTLLFVGRFDKRKGGDIMLRAFRKVLDVDPSLRLVFAGPDTGLTNPDGSRIFFQTFLDNLFEPRLRKHVDYLGPVPNTQLPLLRTRALVTLAVSRWESQGYTALEAMAQGCPVIVSDTDGLNEIVEHNVTGLIARNQDVDDLCDKIMSLVKDPARATHLGQNARKMVAHRFSLDKLANETLKVYRSALALHQSVIVQ